MPNWFNDYRHYSLTGTLNGRTGMTEIPLISPTDNNVQLINLPFTVDPLRNRVINQVGIYPISALYLDFFNSDSFLDSYYEHLWETTPGSYDFRDTSTNWVGTRTQGTAPNRTFILRLEYDTTTVPVVGKIIEYKFYEALPTRIDIITQSSTAENIRINLWARNNSTIDGAFTPDDDFPSWTIYYTLDTTDDTDITLSLRDSWNTAVLPPDPNDPSSTPSPPPPPPSPPPPPVGPPPPPAAVYTGNRILYYDQVWKGNANLALALTKADVGKHNTSSNTLTIINIQNASNTQLDFNPFEINETVYTSDSGFTFKFTNESFIIYLDTNLAGNGYGFIPGSIVSQYCPRVTRDIVLTEDEYLSICGCSSCGCVKNECGCVDGPSTAQDRTVTIVLSEARNVSATIDYESIDPPFIAVSNANGKFCFTNITSGGITANVVGSLTPPLERDPFLGNYIIQRPGVYGFYSLDDCCNATMGDNLGQFLGAHIGIDRHFTARRSQDYNDDNIIVSNWDITGRNVPIGAVKDYWNDASYTYNAIGMSVNANSYSSSSKLLRLTSNNKNNAEITIQHTGGLFVNTDITDTFFKIDNRCDDILTVANNITVNTTMYTRGYAEKHSAPSGTTLDLDVSKAVDFTVPSSTTVVSVNFQKPTATANAVYVCNLIVPSSATIQQSAWNNVLWPEGVIPAASDANPRVLSFMNVHDTSNVTQQSIWYGFGNIIEEGGGGGGDFSFPWYKPTRSHNITILYQWTPTQGVDLDTRTWLTVPAVDLSWENDIVGWNYASQVYIGDAPNSNSDQVMSFSGDDTTANGTEIIVIPVDTIAYSYPSLDDTVAGIVGYANTYIPNYTLEIIPNELSGRAGMNVIYDRVNADVGDVLRVISTPFTLTFAGEFPYSRSNTIVFDARSLNGGGYMVFDEYTANIYWDFIETNQFTSEKFVWIGEKVDGTAPDRVYTIRMECANTYAVWPAVAYQFNMSNTVQYTTEVKFYENVARVYDIHYGEMAPDPTGSDWQLRLYDNAFDSYPLNASPELQLTSNVYSYSSFRANLSTTTVVNPIMGYIYDKYFDIHCGAFWYATRGTGDFSFTLINDVTDSRITLTPSALHRDVVGTGPNEFATFRVFLKYLNIIQIA